MESSGSESDLSIKAPRPANVVPTEQQKEEEEEETSVSSDDEDSASGDEEGDDDDDDDDDDDSEELSELSEEEEGGDDSLRVPIAVVLVTGATVTFQLDPKRTTVRRLKKLGLASQPPGYSKRKLRMWLNNGGANGTRPLENGKKLADYGIGPNQGVTMQYNYQKNRCCECCYISALIVLFVLTCGFCFWGCKCLRSHRCRRRHCFCCC